MFQLIETIKIADRKLCNIVYHNARYNAARSHFFHSTDFIHLEDLIAIPEAIDNGLYKCRVTDSGIETKIEITPYSFRKIASLKIVEITSIDYEFKTNRRELLDAAYRQKGTCDDVLIFRNGLLTDSWVANVLLLDGQNWVTPKNPLLKGTQRASLLTTKRITEMDIPIVNLMNYKKLKLINAMVDFEDAIEIDIQKVQF